MEVSSLISIGECTQSPVPLLSQEFGGGGQSECFTSLVTWLVPLATSCHPEAL